MISLVLALAGVATTSASRDLLDMGSSPGAWSYSYGGSTKGEIAKSKDSTSLTYSGDDNEYSGWTLHLPRSLDLSAIRVGGALKLRVQGARGGEEVFVGLMDDESDGPGKKIQVRVPLKNYAPLDKNWKSVTIPLADFEDQGSWWDDKAKQEISGRFDWSKVAEVRISSNRGVNRTRSDSAGIFRVAIAEWTIADTSGVWNAAAYWKHFKSDAPDDTLERFGGENPQSRWFLAADDASKRSMKAADPKDGAALEFSYTMGSWTTLGASLANIPGRTKGNWNRHGGMAVDIWSPRNGVGLQVQVTDSGKEQWVKNIHLAPGWNSVVVPFKAFVRNGNWQPDGAVANGRMDLGSVQTLGFQPLDQGVATTLRFKDVRLTNQGLDPKRDKRPDEIRWNHLGYAPRATKRFVVANPTDSVFEVADASGKIALNGRLVRAGRWEPSDEEVAQGDFTGLQAPGTYTIRVGKSRSLPFKIALDVYGNTLVDATRAFYFQRASTDLLEKHAGIWQRTGGHPDKDLPLFEAGREGKWSAPGGWYDAGDYGKYTLNGAVSVGILLQAYELFPKQFSDRAMNIPESGNGKPDLLDECAWELDWMTRMQDEDGGLFFKVASRTWDGMEMPTKTKHQRHVIGKSTTATLTFAAAAAQASRLLKGKDATRAKDYLARAERAWAWAKKNPAVREPRETGGSGPYEDSNMSDEFLWAGTELWLATGKPEYRAAAKAGLDTVAILQTTSWQNVQNLAHYSLGLKAPKDSLGAKASSRIDSMASEIRKQIEASAYRVPLEGFPWASNDVALQKAALLAWADRFKPGAAGSGIQESVDYVLGKNAMGTSFVTGTGERSAMNPHHRVLAGDTVALPFPGFVVGGPNADRQDDIKHAPWGVEYPHTEPAKCWVDVSGSYASNEVAINWNAALVFTLAALVNQLNQK